MVTKASPSWLPLPTAGRQPYTLAWPYLSVFTALLFLKFLLPGASLWRPVFVEVCRPVLEYLSSTPGVGVTDHSPVTRCVSWLCVYVLAVISFLLLPPQPSRAMGPSSLSPKPDSVLSVDSSPWEGGLIDGRCGGLTKSARHRLNV